MHKHPFFEFGEQDIIRGFGYTYDHNALLHASQDDTMVDFAYDTTLQKLAMWYFDSDNDMSLMLIKYHDEITHLLKS